MARPLNTKKLMKQCRQIAAEQQAKPTPAPEPLPIPVEEKEVLPMTPVELEQYLTEFQVFARDANRRYEEAVALEQSPNSAIQDILHAAEFAPSILENVNLLSLLHKFRLDRRAAKQELEVTELFKNWATTHKTALDQLNQVIGEMRKVLRRQPNDFYSYKTDAVQPKGSILKPDEKGEESNENENSTF